MTPQQAGTASAAVRGISAPAAVTPRYMTTDEFAELVRAPTETVRYWRATGKGPRSIRLGRRVLYAVDDVDHWLAEERQRQAAETA